MDHKHPCNRRLQTSHSLSLSSRLIHGLSYPLLNALARLVKEMVDNRCVRDIAVYIAAVLEIVLADRQWDGQDVVCVANNPDCVHAWTCCQHANHSLGKFNGPDNSPIIMCVRIWQWSIHTPGWSIRMRQPRQPAAWPGFTLS